MDPAAPDSGAKAPDSNAGAAAAGSAVGGGAVGGAPLGGAAGSSASGRTTPAWNGLATTTPEDVSRLAKAALQTPALFTAGAGANGTGGADGGAAAAAAAAAAAGTLLDPQALQGLTTDQLNAVLQGGYSAASLNALGAAGLPTDQSTLNTLLLSGVGLNQFAGMLNPASLSDPNLLNMLAGGADPGDLDDAGGAAAGKGLTSNANKQLSSRYR